MGLILQVQTGALCSGVKIRFSFLELDPDSSNFPNYSKFQVDNAVKDQPLRNLQKTIQNMNGSAIPDGLST